MARDLVDKLDRIPNIFRLSAGHGEAEPEEKRPESGTFTHLGNTEQLLTFNPGNGMGNDIPFSPDNRTKSGEHGIISSRFYLDELIGNRGRLGLPGIYNDHFTVTE
jgi:hypothetical protein